MFGKQSEQLQAFKKEKRRKPELIVFDIGIRNYPRKLRNPLAQPLHTPFWCPIVNIGDDKRRLLGHSKLPRIKHNRRPASIAAVAPPHRKQPVVIFLCMLGQTEDVMVKYMLVPQTRCSSE